MTVASRRSKAEVREYLLSKLESIIESSDEKTSDRLKAIGQMGTEFGLFVEQKNIKVDVSSIVRHFTDGQISTLLQDGKGDVLDAEIIHSDEGILPDHSGDSRDITPIRSDRVDVNRDPESISEDSSA